MPFSDLYEASAFERLRLSGGAAAFGAAYLVALADGVPTPGELAAIDAQLEKLLDGKGARRGARETAKVTMAAVLEDKDAYLAKLADSLPEQATRRAVLAVAAATAFADGKIHGAELDTLGELAAAFGLSSDDAASLFDRVRRLSEEGAL